MTGAKQKQPKPVFHQVYDIVRQIPEGRVLTYGVISDIIEARLSAQGVGWAMHGLSAHSKNGKGLDYNSKTVPWHRVVNSRGGTSTYKLADMPPDLQRHLLEKEGVVFDDDRIDLGKYLWLEGLENLSRGSRKVRS